MQELFHLLPLLLVGMLFGFINTVASSGSAISLPLMIMLGLPPTVANATNRVPLMFGLLTSLYKFNKAKLIDWNKTSIMLVPIIGGTLIGSIFVEQLPPQYIQYIIFFALLLSLTFILLKPKAFINKHLGEPKPITWISYILLFLIGVWGGLIVIDMATFMLFTLVLHQGYDLNKANATKIVLSVAIGTLSSIIFGMHGDIDWLAASLLTIGSLIGANFGSAFSLKENSRKWSYRIIITMILTELTVLILKEL